jgi:hypothetical protein
VGARLAGGRDALQNNGWWWRLTSKTSQDQAVEVVIPKADMRAAYDALSAWAERAALQPGFPIFRGVTKSARSAVRA